MVCCQLIVSPLVGCHWKPSPYHWVQLNQASLASKTIAMHCWPLTIPLAGVWKDLFQSMTDVGLNKAIGHSINNWKNYWPFYRCKILQIGYRYNQQFWIWQGFQTRVLIRCSCDWQRSAGRLVPPPLLLMMQLLSKSDTLFNIHKCVHCCLMINLNIWRLE